MFGLPSIGKILILAVIVIAAWKLLTFFKNKNGTAPATKKQQNAESNEADIMVLCPKCAVYIAKNDTQNCGKEHCPYL